jgi:hypothetical protein
MNLYRYVGNSTPNYVDPMGTIAWLLPFPWIIPIAVEIVSIGGALIGAGMIWWGAEEIGEICSTWVFSEAEKDKTAAEILSKKKGSVKQEFPSELLGKTLREIGDMAKCGQKNAKKAKKLLTDKRFDK